MKILSLFYAIIMTFLFLGAGFAQNTIRGVIICATNNQTIVGASIVVVGQQPVRGTISGLDGSFVLSNVSAIPAEIAITFMGYKAQNIRVINDVRLNILLEEDASSIVELVVTAENRGHTDGSAMAMEKNAMNLINVISARAIEISPDMTVANVIQRMSGVTMERDNSGEGQYALLRGMDKRFNYTLVNGVKIPSPDNKNRFVPLDIFPSELLDRLEVTKAVTADMEGDGIGGAVNMVMRDAPTKPMLNINVSTGMNTQFFDRNYLYFDHNVIERQSVMDIYGGGVPLKMSDFTNENLILEERTVKPNLAAGFSTGGRLFNNYLGIILAGTYSNAYRGSTSDRYSLTRDDEGLQEITWRNFSQQQQRSGVHIKFDVRLNLNHKIMWYNALMDFQNIQVRDSRTTSKHDYRMRWNQQQIRTSTLKGKHSLIDNLSVDWAISAGQAFNRTPDNTSVHLRVGRDGKAYTDRAGSTITRRWENNSDKDISGYANITYNQNIGAANVQWKIGAMARDKKRESLFHRYTFRTVAGNIADGGNIPANQFRGEHFERYRFDQIMLSNNTNDMLGEYTDPLNFKATEKINAGYAQLQTNISKIQIISGLRIEHTQQGYEIEYSASAITGTEPAGIQKYYDLLPSLHLRYALNTRTNIRASYYKAINRPSFFEIVPYRKEFEDYEEQGNPNVKRTVGHNIDLRWEYFPRPSEQFMVGLFYKQLKNPIEYAFDNIGMRSYYTPMNFGTSYNTGLEIDMTKYFRWLGIKTNYTFTHSQITTNKWFFTPQEEIEDVKQTRPLFGQAAHVANLSLLYKGLTNGWDAQLALSYTGKRLTNISHWIDQDWWQDGYFRLDASIDKQFTGTGITAFAKANNLLNTAMYQYINKNNMHDVLSEDYMRRQGGILERIEYYGTTITIGLKYKF